MGQYALISVLAVMTIGAVLLFNAQNAAQAADDQLTEYHEDRFGRELALVGLKRTERLLSQNPTTWALKTTDDAAAQSLYGAATTAFERDAFRGTYAVSYDTYTPKTSTTPELASVTATGVYNGKAYTVQAIYEQGETSIGLPPQYRQAIVADDRLYLNGAVTIHGSTHTNADMDGAGGNYQINGSSTAVNTAGSNVNQSQVSGGFGSSPPIAVPPVVVPTDYDHRVATAARLGTQNSTLSTGGLSVTTGGGQGTTTTTSVTGAGTMADPYIFVVNGNLEIVGDVRLVGYSRIYVNGDLSIQGQGANLAPVPSNVALPTGSSTPSQIASWVATHLPNGGQMGVYVTGTVEFGGNPSVVANIHANGEIRYWGSGGRLVIGGLTSGDGIDARGNASIYYTQANAQVVMPGGTTTTPNGVRLVSYREWATR